MRILEYYGDTILKLLICKIDPMSPQQLIPRVKNLSLLPNFTVYSYVLNAVY